jgi:hypothetical protein
MSEDRPKISIFIRRSGVYARSCKEETVAKVSQDRVKRAHREECWGSLPSEMASIHEDDGKQLRRRYSVSVQRGDAKELGQEKRLKCSCEKQPVKRLKNLEQSKVHERGAKRPSIEVAPKTGEENALKKRRKSLQRGRRGLTEDQCATEEDT